MTDLNDPKALRDLITTRKGFSQPLCTAMTILIDRLEKLELKTGFTVNREGEQVAQGPQMPLRGGPGARTETIPGPGAGGDAGRQLNLTQEQPVPTKNKATVDALERHAREVKSQTDAVTDTLRVLGEPERLRQEEANAEAGYKTTEQINQTPVQFLHTKRELARLKEDIQRITSHPCITKETHDRRVAELEQEIARLKADQDRLKGWTCSTPEVVAQRNRIDKGLREVLGLHEATSGDEVLAAVQGLKFSREASIVETPCPSCLGKDMGPAATGTPFGVECLLCHGAGKVLTTQKELVEDWAKLKTANKSDFFKGMDFCCRILDRGAFETDMCYDCPEHEGTVQLGHRIRALVVENKNIRKAMQLEMAKNVEIAREREDHRDTVAENAKIKAELANYRAAAGGSRHAQDRAQDMFRSKGWARLGENLLTIALDRIEALEKERDSAREILRQCMLCHGAGKVLTTQKELVEDWAKIKQERDQFEAGLQHMNNALAQERDQLKAELEARARADQAFTADAELIEVLKAEVKRLEQERDSAREIRAQRISGLRRALIDIGRTVGAMVADDVSDEFLCMVPDEVRLVVDKLRQKAIELPGPDQMTEDWVKAHICTLPIEKLALIAQAANVLIRDYETGQRWQEVRTLKAKYEAVCADMETITAAVKRACR